MSKTIKKFSILLLVLLLVASFTMAGCGQQEQKKEAAKKEKIEITFATGGAGGPYHTIATGLSEIWNSEIPEINVTVASTGASVINNRMIDEGKASLAFAMSDVSYYGYKGEAMFKEPLKNVQGFAAAHTNFVQLITRKDSGIKSVSELKGKRVGVGAPGSGTELNAQHILKAYGMTYEDLGKADYLSYAESCEQLANRNIDAAFLTGGLPIASITELATKQDIAIIPIDKETVEEMQKSFPIYVCGEIPAGTYKGVDANTQTLALKNYILVNKDIDEEIVYKMVASMYKNIEKLRTYHSAANQITLEKALEAMALPTHPGVAKFYKEKGIAK